MIGDARSNNDIFSCNSISFSWLSFSFLLFWFGHLRKLSRKCKQSKSFLNPTFDELWTPWAPERIHIILVHLFVQKCNFWADTGDPGFHPHPPALRYRVLSQLLGASMWFFIFYRAKCVIILYISHICWWDLFRQDGPKLLVGVVSSFKAAYSFFSLGGTSLGSSRWRTRSCQKGRAFASLESIHLFTLPTFLHSPKLGNREQMCDMKRGDLQ